MVFILLLVLDAVTQTVLIAALAMGQVLSEWNLLTLGVVLAGVIGLSNFRRMVLPMLMNLL